MSNDWFGKFKKDREKERNTSEIKENFFGFLKVLLPISPIIIIGFIAFFMLSYKSEETPSYTYHSFNGTEYIHKDTREVPSDIRSKFNDIVVFNYNTMIYHETWCEWAEECVDNCVYMEREEAKKYARHCYECVHHSSDDSNESDSEDYLEDSVPDKFQ